jgi:hypothetical protein
MLEATIITHARQSPVSANKIASRVAVVNDRK